MRKNRFALAAGGAALAAAAPAFAIRQPGGFVEAWGQGTIVSTNPASCTANHKCEKIATGTGEAKVFFEAGDEIGKYAFKADFTFDRADSTPNGFGQQCHPVGGTLGITPQGGRQGALVLDIEGQACALGTSTTLSTITATYVVDGVSSIGKFAGATGVGTFNWQANDSALPAAVILSFSGNLHF